MFCLRRVGCSPPFSAIEASPSSCIQPRHMDRHPSHPGRVRHLCRERDIKIASRPSKVFTSWLGTRCRLRRTRMSRGEVWKRLQILVARCLEFHVPCIHGSSRGTKPLPRQRCKQRCICTYSCVCTQRTIAILYYVLPFTKRERHVMELVTRAETRLQRLSFNVLDINALSTPSLSFAA